MIDSITFRIAIGILALVGGIGGLAGLYFVEVPEGNREPLLLALGLVLGWGSTVIGYEFGSSPAGRKAADVGVRLAEQLPSPAPARKPAPADAREAADEVAEAAVDRADEIGRTS